MPTLTRAGRVQLVIEHERLGPISDAVAAAVDDLSDRKAVSRLWSGDHTLWQDDPTEVADRLGWLAVVAEMEQASADLERFALAAVADGFRHAVLLGICLLYTSPSPRDGLLSRMPSSA